MSATSASVSVNAAEPVPSTPTDPSISERNSEVKPASPASEKPVVKPETKEDQQVYDLIGGLEAIADPGTEVAPIATKIEDHSKVALITKALRYFTLSFGIFYVSLYLLTATVALGGRVRVPAGEQQSCAPRDSRYGRAGLHRANRESCSHTV